MTDSAVTAALDHLQRRGLAPDTLRAVASTARLLQGHMGKTVRDATQIEIEAFVGTYVDRAPATQAGLVVRLRLLFGALVELGLIEVDPTARLVSIRSTSGPQPVLGVDQIRRLLEVAGNPARYRFQGEVLARRDQACLELLYGVGLRRSEAGRLSAADLRLADGSVVVRRSKRGGIDSLPLPRRSLEPLRRYLGEARPVLGAGPKGGSGRLLLSFRGGPLGGAGVWRVVKRVAKAAGVAARPHDCRRSLATHLVEAGVNVEAVRLLLGHADLGTTARYVQMSRKELRRVVGLLEG